MTSILRCQTIGMSFLYSKWEVLFSTKAADERNFTMVMLGPLWVPWSTGPKLENLIVLVTERLRVSLLVGHFVWNHHRWQTLKLTAVQWSLLTDYFTNNNDNEKTNAMSWYWHEGPFLDGPPPHQKHPNPWNITKKKGSKPFTNTTSVVVGLFFTTVPAAQNLSFFSLFQVTYFLPAPFRSVVEAAGAQWRPLARPHDMDEEGLADVPWYIGLIWKGPNLYKNQVSDHLHCSTLYIWTYFA